MLRGMMLGHDVIVLSFGICGRTKMMQPALRAAGTTARERWSRRRQQQKQQRPNLWCFHYRFLCTTPQMAAFSRLSSHGIKRSSSSRFSVLL